MKQSEKLAGDLVQFCNNMCTLHNLPISFILEFLSSSAEETKVTIYYKGMFKAKQIGSFYVTFTGERYYWPTYFPFYRYFDKIKSLLDLYDLMVLKSKQ